MTEQERHSIQSLLQQAGRPGLGYRDLDALVRARRKLAAESNLGAAPPRLRIAIVSDATVNYLTGPLGLLLESRGIQADLHVLPYGSAESEIMNPDSDFSRSKPQLLLFMQTPLAIRDWPDELISADESRAYMEARVSHVLGLCKVAHEQTGCDVLLGNWHSWPHRPHGSFGRRLPGERNSLIRGMNARLDSGPSGWLHLHDVDSVSAAYGTGRWVDWRLWFHAKQPMAFEAIPAYVHSLAASIAALFRTDVKCVVVDLDNTMWGGVIGDDGLKGILVQQGDPTGEAFLSFQSYLLRLRRRGILLAICSKNEKENALLPFQQLGEMRLKLDDFVAIRANWDPKPGNIRSIAKELNIGLDSIVFVDDNPVEREHVRSELPMVRVAELSDDPADYPDILDRTGWFEISKVSAEDAERTLQYQQNTQRQELAATAGDYQSYLRSLEQHAIISGFRPEQMDRISQLINKTNQFNLTTRRVGGGDVEALARRDDALRIAVRLQDRFGDNGLIAVCYGSIRGDQLTVEQWLMSCRVFNRGVEHMTMNRLVELARSRGVREIVGEYIPTKKNGIVKDLYQRLGFSPRGGSPPEQDSPTSWTKLVDEYTPLEHTIHITTEEP